MVGGGARPGRSGAAGQRGAASVMSHAAAERQAAELRAVLESMPDAVYIGTAEGITLANQPALDQLGFRSRDELNRHVKTLAEEIQTRDAATGHFIPVENQAFMRAFRGERVVQDVIVRHRLTGRDRVVRCAAAPVTVDGEVIAAVAVNTDVTEARQSAQRLRELNETLERRVAEAITERTLLAEIVETRTPLFRWPTLIFAGLRLTKRRPASSSRFTASGPR